MNVPREEKELVISFLEACLAYALASVDRKTDRGDDQAVIEPWLTYISFTRRTIDETRAGYLDSWWPYLGDPNFIPQPTGWDESSNA